MADDILLEESESFKFLVVHLDGLRAYLEWYNWSWNYVKGSTLILLRKLPQFCSVVLGSKKGLLWRDKSFPTFKRDQLRKVQTYPSLLLQNASSIIANLKLKRTPVLGRLNHLIPDVVFSRTRLCSFNLPNRSRVDLSTTMRLRAGTIILHWTSVRAFANWMWHCIIQQTPRWPEIVNSHTKFQK